MKTKLSAFAWAIHDIGLACAVGGTIFAKIAFHPATRQISNPQERDLVLRDAWRRFTFVNVGAHVAYALPWLVGRRLLSGREAGPMARNLTIAKDILIGGGILTGVVSMFLGLALGRRVANGHGPTVEPQRSHLLEQVVSGVGTANLATNAGALALTSLLAMQSSKSRRFTLLSRRLP